MTSTLPNGNATAQGLPKAPTGIRGLDEITAGGLPRGRPTLVAGGAGSGKTLLGLEFLIRGAVEYGEPGVLMTFEETARELSENVRSLGFDLEELARQKKLHVDHVRLERGETVEAGEYDLEGLFIRLDCAISSLGARRVVLDTIECLFAGLTNSFILRSELSRLFRWLKDRGVTALVTAERGEGTLTRHGLEEYVSDCVIALDHRVTEQVCTRRLRIVKYRGSTHGTNEYPFLIGERGISVLPVTSLGLQHEASTERISTGIPRLDAMLGGQGFYRGSSILVSGSAGTGKSSMAATFADAACRRGERCLYIATEESRSQVLRNMRSIGLDLDAWITRGLLYFHAAHPSSAGLEMHLVAVHKQVEDFRPQVVILDPASSLVRAGAQAEAAAMMLRLIDLLKGQGITALLTSLAAESSSLGGTDLAISSLIDTWLRLRDLELGGERNRGLYILKSRGMAHSNQIRELLLTDHGIELLDVHPGPAGALTGSMRLSQEARERAAATARQDEITRKKRMLGRKRRTVEAQITALRLDLEAEEEEVLAAIARAEAPEEVIPEDRLGMAHSRKADGVPEPHGSTNTFTETGGT